MPELHEFRKIVEETGIRIAEGHERTKVDGCERIRQLFDIKPYITDFTVLKDSKDEKICIFGDHYYFYTTVFKKI